LVGSNSVYAFFALLYLLKGEAACLAQLLLAHAEHLAPNAQSAPDVNADRIGSFAPRHL
jgi:hypothetical protein